MTRNAPDALVIVDESHISLGELARRCDLRAEHLIAMVDWGILEPQGAQAEWRFPPASVQTVAMVRRLQQDLAVNLPGAALAIELMEELGEVRGRVRLLEQLLFQK